MRAIKLFAFIFGIANLIFGALLLFALFVTPRPRRRLERLLPRRHNGQEGLLFGVPGGVNPPHAIMHFVLGAAFLLLALKSGSSSRSQDAQREGLLMVETGLSD